VLAGDGTAEAENQIGGFFHEPPISLYAFVRSKSKLMRCGTQAAEMPVHAAAVA